MKFDCEDQKERNCKDFDLTSFCEKSSCGNTVQNTVHGMSIWHNLELTMNTIFLDATCPEKTRKDRASLQRPSVASCAARLIIPWCWLCSLLRLLHGLHGLRHGEDRNCDGFDLTSFASSEGGAVSQPFLHSS